MPWSCSDAANPEAVVAELLGKQGASSSAASQQQAGLAALRTCMAEAPDALLSPLHAQLEAQLQRADHDALSPADIAKWSAPEGVLAAEVNAQDGFVAEVVEDKNVRKVQLLTDVLTRASTRMCKCNHSISGRTRLLHPGYASAVAWGEPCWCATGIAHDSIWHMQPRGRFKTDYYDDDDAPPSKPSHANGTAAVRPSQKPASKPSGKAGAKKDPAAERRARLLAEEAEVHT